MLQVATPNLDDILKIVENLSPENRAELVKQTSHVLNQPFIPTPGPQSDALHSDADILLYGGQGGGGKSSLEVGCAALGHSEGIIFRREATQLDGLITFSQEIFASIGNFNKVEKVWTFGEGKKLKFAGLPQADDWRKHAGNARDYMAFDEAGEFLKEQVFSLLGWLRSVKVGQRCRMILASNPPRGGDGLWLLDEFDPWLAAARTERAAFGELRWAIVVGGETEWVDGPGIYERNDEEYEALSRTFIPASLDDNPYLKNTGYRARLQALPEPLRSQLLYGDFTAGREDHEWQVIPSKWIAEARNRWTNQPPEDIRMTAVSCDVAQGGSDHTVIQARYDNWYGPFTSFEGKDTPDGPTVAGEIIKVMRDRCRVVVDAGGGYGGDTLTQLAHADVDCFGFKGALASTSKSRDGMFTFRNFRAQAVWQFREALDPTYGSQIALPPDPELFADLTAFRYEMKDTKHGAEILVGPKDEMRERLGRSPDKGDTAIMLFVAEARGLKRPNAAQERRRNKDLQLKAITGRTQRRKRKKR